MKLKNKVALITGGSGGIGKIVSKTFLKEGAKLIIASNNNEELKTSLKELKMFGEIKAIKTDITDIEEVENLIKQIKNIYGKIDILINMVGTQLPIGPLVELNTDELIKNIETNFTGVIFCCKEVLPIMIQNKSGKIINFSGGGSLSPRPNFSIYGAAKTAVIRFSETIAEEVKNLGIDVNIIAPGALNTRMVTDVLEAGEKAGKDELKKAKEIKNQGGTSPEIVAELLVFLSSETSNGITGKLISAPWDDWKNFNKKVSNSSLYTLRRIDNKNFFEKK